MVIGKIFSRLIQAIPSWEMTKYYGRICVFQLKCIKYRIETSEAWFNFKCKFMPGSIKAAAESKTEESKMQEINSCQTENKLDKLKGRIRLPEKLNPFLKNTEKSSKEKK